MKRMLPAVLFFTLLISCNKHNDNPNAINQTDKDFILQTYFLNKTHMQSGQLALAQSGDNTVKYFANAIFHQFAAAQTDLIAVANKINFNLSDTLKSNELPPSTPGNFNEYSDAAYIKSSVQTLQSSLQLFQKELNGGNNTYLRYYYLNKYITGTKDLYLFADSLARKF